MMTLKKKWRFSLSICLAAGLAMMATGIGETAQQASDDGMSYEAGFYYTVKKGDTLWDLSQRFDDTPWQWPDLWEKNKQLPNPHWIYPGQRIRLFRKKDFHPTEQPKTDIGPTDAQITASTPEEMPKPVVHYVYPGIDRLGFIRNPAVTPLGSIFKARDDRTLLSKGDLVYLRNESSGTSSDFSPGMRLTVYRTLNPVDDRKIEHSFGVQHMMLGLAEITQVQPKFALAKIIDSYRNITIEDLVMAYDQRYPQIEIRDATPGIDGRLIVGEEHTKLIGEQFIAFIDKGRQDNILPGQLYNLYNQEYGILDDPKNPVALDKVDIGTLLVLQTEETTSTVIITDSSKQIIPGQPFHTP